jgi:hypothetical protein
MNKSDLIELLIIFVKLKNNIFLFGINNIQVENTLKEYEIFLLKNKDYLNFNIEIEIKELKNRDYKSIINYCNTNIDHLKNKILN